jgi:hypothetical protein
MNGPPVEVLSAVDGRTYLVPASMVAGNVARCRGCDAFVMWVTTAAGKRMPLNVNGTSHFSDCPRAASFRRPRP